MNQNKVENGSNLRPVLFSVLFVSIKSQCVYVMFRVSIFRKRHSNLVLLTFSLLLQFIPVLVPGEENEQEKTCSHLILCFTPFLFSLFQKFFASGKGLEVTLFEHQFICLVKRRKNSTGADEMG